MRRLTFDPATDTTPVWATDGQQLFFASARAGGQLNLYRKAADGTGQVERLLESPTPQHPTGISPDGKQLVLTEEPVLLLANLFLLNLEDGGQIEPLLLAGHTNNAAISPDGRWLAYQSGESAAAESDIYVRPFPDADAGVWQVSYGGGTRPVWGPDGSELFYLIGNRLMVVPVESAPGFSSGTPELLFEGAYFSPPWFTRVTARTYDISPDGKRFLMIKELDEKTESIGPPKQLHLILNWFEELKRLVPTDN